MTDLTLAGSDLWDDLVPENPPPTPGAPRQLPTKLVVLS